MPRRVGSASAVNTACATNSESRWSSCGIEIFGQLGPLHRPPLNVAFVCPGHVVGQLRESDFDHRDPGAAGTGNTASRYSNHMIAIQYRNIPVATNRARRCRDDRLSPQACADVRGAQKTPTPVCDGLERAATMRVDPHREEASDWRRPGAGEALVRLAKAAGGRTEVSGSYREQTSATAAVSQ